jgi:hypothetical protein
MVLQPYRCSSYRLAHTSSALQCHAASPHPVASETCDMAALGADCCLLLAELENTIIPATRMQIGLWR